MTDNFIFLVTFDVINDNFDGWSADGTIRTGLNTAFDCDNIPQAFAKLDDAKAWILKTVHDGFGDDADINITPDSWLDTDFNDVICTFGIGFGAIGSWLTVHDDDDDVTVRFWIHKMQLH